MKENTTYQKYWGGELEHLSNIVIHTFPVRAEVLGSKVNSGGIFMHLHS